MKTSEKNALKARAHHLHPVILVGGKGVTPALIEETNIALQAHELIKVKVVGEDKEERKAMALAICEATTAEFIQLIGNIAIIYRKRQED